MSFRASRLAATSLALALILSGCSLSALPTGTGGGKTGTGTTTGGTGATGGGTGTTTNVDGGIVHNLPLEPLNGVEFKPITAGTSKFIANNGGIVAAGGGNAISSNGAAGVASAPMAKSAAAPSAAIAADAAVSRGGSGGGLISSEGAGLVSQDGGNAGGGAYSGNVWSYYGYNGYFGGYGDQQMALVSMQQAELPGNKGSFADVIATTAGPIVKAWATDARLVSSNAMIDNNGALLQPEGDANGKLAPDAILYGGWGDPTGWSLTYASTRRTEVLSFTVTASKTTVVRMRWEPLSLDPTRVSTDSASAVKKIIAAVKDKAFKGAEETSGKDYFLGFPFDQPKTGQWDGDYQRTEVVYDVPANARWNVSLQEIMGKLVWQMNYYAPYDGTNGGIGIATPVAAAEPTIVKADANTDTAKPAVCTPQYQEQNGWFNNSAQGMVDAETGAVIRFSRPTRTYYKQLINDCAAPPVETTTTATVGSAVAVEKK